MEPWLENFARANFRRSADTAHDLKTPLNVAVLNLELLRMRIAKLTDGDDDPKLNGYTRAIDTELRRMGQIFDAFFLLSTPPKDSGAPQLVDLELIAREVASSNGLELGPASTAPVLVHEARIRQALKLFFDGATRLSAAGGLAASVGSGDGWFRIDVRGPAADETLEPSKVFKFYYTDAAGNPDLSLASARVIVETYGGDVSAVQENGRVELSLRLPLGER